MKKTIGRILGFCLALCLAFPALAAEPVNANLLVHVSADPFAAMDGKWALYAVAVGQDLYLLTGTTLEKWAPGMAEPETVMEGIRALPNGMVGSQEESLADITPLLSQLFTDGARLFALDVETGKVWKLADGEDLLEPAAQGELDWNGMLYHNEDGSAFFNLNVVSLALEGEQLFLLGFDYDKDPYNPILYRWNLETGEAKEPLLGTHMQALTPFRDGQFLCVMGDWEHAYDEATGELLPVSLGVFDPATGKAESLLSLDTGMVDGLSYDAATHTAYYCVGGALMSLPNMEKPAKTSAYFPVAADSAAGAGLLGSAMYYINRFDGAYVRQINPPGLERGALTLYGATDNTPLLAMVKEHPEMAVVNSDRFYGSAQELISAITQGKDAPDVMVVSTASLPVDRLLEKGYALDLGESAKITAFAQDMNPLFTDFASRDGKLMALPLSMDGGMLAYSPEVLKTLGLSETDVPKTFGELFAFAAKWQDAYAKDHADVQLFDRVAVKGDLLSLLMNNYAAYCRREGQAIDFTSPLFAEPLRVLEALSLPEENGGDGGEGEYWENPSLFTTYYGIAQFYTDTSYVPMPLAVAADTKPVIPVDLTVAIMNPRTPRKEAAMLYMETLLTFYDPIGANITLFPGHNQPVPYALFDQTLAEQEADLADAKARLEAADPEVQADIQQEIQFLEEFVTNPEQYMTRTLVTAEQIATFREKVEPCLFVEGTDPLFAQNDEENAEGIYALSQEYLLGAINADQFMSELTQRVKLMEMEKQ